MDPRPEINDPVVLRDHAEREYLSRVEDLGEGLVVVARPHELPTDETFDSGTEMRVVWSDARGGATVLPTRILSAYAEGRVGLWSLVVTGPTSTEQRRRFVREVGSGPVVLRPPKGKKSDVVRGSLVDVSEGAIRVTVGAGGADRFLAGDNAVVAEFGFGTESFVVPGRVEFLRPTKRPAELEDLVVVFDEPVTDADALRKQVFAQQVQALRVRNGDER